MLANIDHPPVSELGRPGVAVVETVQDRHGGECVGVDVERADGGVGATNARPGWQERQAQRSGEARSEHGSETRAR